MQDGAGAEGGSIQTLLTLLADGEEQARQLGQMADDDDPRSRAEHYRGAAWRLQCTLGKAAAVARAIDAGSSSRGTDRSDSPRSADESSGGTTIAMETAQERQSMSKRRKGLPRWTAKFRVPDASLEATPDDGFSWRKYGQKDILGAKFPRGYYRCTYRAAQGCPATKQVQRSDTDLCVFDVTYQGEHACHQKQRHTTAHGGSQSPPPLPGQEQDPSLQLVVMGFKDVLKVETTSELHSHGHGHGHDHGPASAPAAPFSFSFPSAPFHHHGGGEAPDNNATATFSSPPASSYFSAPHCPVVSAGMSMSYGDVYDYDAPAGPGAARCSMRGAEPSELGEVVSRATAAAAPAAFDYSSLFHHHAELDPTHLPFPPFGSPPLHGHGPYPYQ